MTDQPQTPKETPKENPYVHRFSGYLKHLEQHWAYKNTTKTPKGKYDDK